MRWPGPILTDSGGFQVWSLGQSRAGLVKTSSEGIRFHSHLDGSHHFWTPENVILSQLKLGADIIMPLDVCTRTQSKKQAKQSMDITHQWLARSIKTWKTSKSYQLKATSLFGIIQGAMFPDLRRQSAEYVVSQDLPGIALGGEMLENNSINKLGEIMDWIDDILPADKPRHALGIGLDPSDLIDGILAGCDMFDCVAPTRLARTGQLYIGQVKFSRGIPRFVSPFPNMRLDISKSIWKKDPKPLDEKCDCFTCREGYSKAYLHHLFKSRELLYYRLASIHNLRTMVKTVEDISNLKS